MRTIQAAPDYCDYYTDCYAYSRTTTQVSQCPTLRSLQLTINVCDLLRVHVARVRKVLETRANNLAPTRFVVYIALERFGINYSD